MRTRIGRIAARRHRAGDAAGISPEEDAPCRASSFATACPHDCPSTCALEVERLAPERIGTVRGRAGERLHLGRHLRQGRALRRARPPSRPPRCIPCSRKGGKGVRRRSERIRLGRCPRHHRRGLPRAPNAEARSRKRSGPTSSPAPWASCMRDGINRLRHAKNYSRHARASICTTAGVRPAGGPEPAQVRCAAPTRARWRKADLRRRSGAPIPRQHPGQRHDPHAVEGTQATRDAARSSPSIIYRQRAPCQAVADHGAVR